MDTFSGGEFIAFFLGFFLALRGWAGWYMDMVRVVPRTPVPGLRLALGICPIACLLAFVLILLEYSSWDVQGSLAYLVAYTVLGAGWLALATKLFIFTGISIRDDLWERSSVGAGVAALGAMAGTTACFAGANIGNGPGVEVVLFSALLSTGAFFLLWTVVEWIAHPAERTTVDREIAPGIRLAGFLMAQGVILGSAIAGDWVDTSATVRDFFHYAWPAVALAVLAVWLERATPPRWPESQGTLRIAVGIGLFYLVVAVGLVWWLE